MNYLATGHAINDSLDDERLDKVLGRVNHDAPVPELWVVDDDGAVHNNVAVEDVVVLDELEEGLEAVARAEEGDGVDAGVELPVVEADLHLVGLVCVPRY